MNFWVVEVPVPLLHGHFFFCVGWVVREGFINPWADVRGGGSRWEECGYYGRGGGVSLVHEMRVGDVSEVCIYNTNSDMP